MPPQHPTLPKPTHHTEPRASFLQAAVWQRVALALIMLGALWLVLLASLSANH